MCLSIWEKKREVAGGGRWAVGGGRWAAGKGRGVPLSPLHSQPSLQLSPPPHPSLASLAGVVGKEHDVRVLEHQDEQQRPDDGGHRAHDLGLVGGAFGEGHGQDVQGGGQDVAWDGVGGGRGARAWKGGGGGRGRRWSCPMRRRRLRPPPRRPSTPARAAGRPLTKYNSDGGVGEAQGGKGGGNVRGLGGGGNGAARWRRPGETWQRLPAQSSPSAKRRWGARECPAPPHRHTPDPANDGPPPHPPTLPPRSPCRRARPGRGWMPGAGLRRCATRW